LDDPFLVGPKSSQKSNTSYGTVFGVKVSFQKGEYMPRRGHSSEQIFNKLRQVEVSVVNGKTVALSVWEIGVTEQTFYRWHSEYRRLSLDQAKKLKRF